MDSQDGSSGAVKIIRKSVKFMWKSRKPTIIIILSFLLPFYALLFAYMINSRNLGLKLAEIFEKSRTMDPAAIAGLVFVSLGGFVLPDLAIVIALFLLSSLLYLTVIYAVKMSLKEREVTLRNLWIEIREKIKSVVVTQLYVYFLSLGYLSFFTALVSAVLLLGPLFVGFYFLAGLICILSFVLLLYLGFVWRLAVVVSVMETGYEGLTALGMSSAVIVGRRAVAIRVICLLLLLGIIVGLVNSVVMSALGKEGIRFIVAEFIYSGMILLLQIFVLAVHALFYEECRSKPVEEVGTQERLLYSRV